MTAILAIETATEACSAALLVNNEIKQRYELAPQQHAQLILPMCQELLSEANLSMSQLDAIAFGRGPGGFTGLRIAAGIAQGLAFAHNLPVIPISSLQALAQEAYLKYQAIKVLAGIDARRNEVYWGRFELIKNLMSSIEEEKIINPNNLSGLTEPIKIWFGVGSAWLQYPSELRKIYANDLIDYDANLYPTARAVALIAIQEHRLGKIIQAEFALPVYLRNQIV